MKQLALALFLWVIASHSFAGRYEEQCRTVSVPYQAETNGSHSGAIGGAAIGGAIGRAITGDNKGTGFGAIIGGVIGSQAGPKTVTRYREERRCSTVFVPERITNPEALKSLVESLNARQQVSVEDTKDVQFTVGTKADGVWGPNSRRAAKIFLESPPRAAGVTQDASPARPQNSASAVSAQPKTPRPATSSAPKRSAEPYCDQQCYRSCRLNEPATSLDADRYCSSRCWRNVKYNWVGLPINVSPGTPGCAGY